MEGGGKGVVGCKLGKVRVNVWEGKGHKPVRQDWEAEDRAIFLGGS